MQHMTHYGVTQAVDYLDELIKGKYSKKYLRLKIHLLCQQKLLEGAHKVGTCWAIPKKSIDDLSKTLYNPDE